MIEYYIVGSDRDGKWYPKEHGMTTMCIQLLLVNYKAKYPPVIHVNFNISLDDTRATAGYVVTHCESSKWSSSGGNDAL